VDPAERIRLGQTDLRVTRLGVGTVPIAGLYEPVSDEQAATTLQRAFDLGVRYFDTAPLYGYGVAEERLGRFVGTVPRPEVIVATKVGRLLQNERPGDEAWHRGPLQNRQFKGTSDLEPIFDFSYEGALRSLEASLQRLGLERVEVVLIHDPDEHYAEALNGAYRALEKLRSQGVIKAIGAGMNQSQMLARFARETDMDCFLLAGRYTLLDDDALDELLPLCTAKGIAIIIGGVFNSGVLVDPHTYTTYNYRPAERAILDRAIAIDEICRRYDVPIAAAAVQFPLGHPAVATVLTGVRSAAEIETNARLFRFPIPDALWQELRSAGLLSERAPTPTNAAAST
jgi:D-threo-aldose 1-dehydrogenase